MTPAAAVLFVFVTHGAMPVPAGDIVAACLRTLPGGIRPITRTAAEAPPDATVQADASAVGAVAAVVVSLTGPDLLSIDVRATVGLPDRPRWVMRRVTFAASDQVPERARALGLVIASILDESYQPPPVAPSSPAVAPAASGSPPEPAASVRAVPVEPVEAREAGAPPRWAIDAVVTTALESGTDGDDTIGGALGLRRLLPHDLALRLGAAFRFTERNSPDITSRCLGGSLGLAWTTPGLMRAGGFGVGGRADLLLVRQSVWASLAPAAGDRVYWSAGVDALAEVGLGLSGGTTLRFATGVEELFSEAAVTIQGHYAATLPRTRILFELGILSRF